MSWNNRVLVTKHKYLNGDEYYVAGIVEVYYDENKKPNGHTDALISTCDYDTPEEAIEQLHLELKRMSNVAADCVVNINNVFDPEEDKIPFVLDRDDEYLEEKYGDN